MFSASSSWRDAEIEKFEEMVLEKTLLARFSTKQPPFKVSLLEDGIDVAATLIKNGLALRNGSKTASTNNAAYLNCNLKVGDVEQVYVSHVNNLSNFFCQLKRQEHQLDTGKLLYSF